MLASTRKWVPGNEWDWVVTMDDATGEHLSMFFCNEESTASSFHGVGQTIARHGLFCALYTDRSSHYFHMSKAGEKVDANTVTQFGRALAQLGIEYIEAHCGLLAASSWAFRAGLRYATAALTSRIGQGQHHRHAASQRLSGTALHATSQRRVRRADR
ncbi:MULTISPECIES: hypothetical protein [Mycetohabitans]|uniref:hypothetical protein n=1 Tax=Mycetohabitans TaxID=2571159 RepID=UPI00158C4728|nr:hypothetical protein [Mycetohabitans sp. B4]MCG1018151.1 hypothetical protein [Mycetohabitans sp. B4]